MTGFRHPQLSSQWIQSLWLARFCCSIRLPAEQFTMLLRVDTLVCLMYCCTTTKATLLNAQLPTLLFVMMACGSRPILIVVVCQIALLLGLLPGTYRQFLLESNLVKEEWILLETFKAMVEKGCKVKCFNSVRKEFEVVVKF